MGFKHEIRSGPLRLYLTSALLLIALLVVAIVTSGCSALEWAGETIVDFATKQPTTVKLTDATVWNQPRVLTNEGFEGMTHFVVKLSEGAEADVYCPVEMADRCLKLVPGQQIKAVKGGWIEVRPPGDHFSETLAVSEATSYEEARMQGTIHEGVPGAPRTAIYLRKLKARPPTYAPTPKK